MKQPKTDKQSRGGRMTVAGLVLGFSSFSLLSSPATAADICGCAGSTASLGAFDSADPSTYPPGTTHYGRGYPDYDHIIRIPLPADGRLIFDSLSIAKGPDGRSAEIYFSHNPANTPVTLLVSGDVTLADTRGGIYVEGSNGSNGSAGINGRAGNGGPGGYRGGEGAYQLVNFASDGGNGLGPAGGGGAGATATNGAGFGRYIGIPELLPLAGGPGGGGGRSTSNAQGCSGGGGGGGGGALLLAANGTVTINGSIEADGGNGGGAGSSSCSTAGAPGAGGAIRIVAGTITGAGKLYARAQQGSSRRNKAGDGRIRLEAFNNSLPGTATDPVASRSPSPGPLTAPLAPRVAITAVQGETLSVYNGEPIATLAQGVFGRTDVSLPFPGPVTVDLATDQVPSGTTVEVRFKPNPGGPPVTQTATLDPLTCDATGHCTTQVTADLVAGNYILEAEATFRVP